jgi:hypothetical protein
MKWARTTVVFCLRRFVPSLGEPEFTIENDVRDGIQPLIGSVGDCDNAPAETTIGLYKTECLAADLPSLWAQQFAGKRVGPISARLGRAARRAHW